MIPSVSFIARFRIQDLMHLFIWVEGEGENLQVPYAELEHICI